MSQPSPSGASGPTDSADRLPILDACRGFALGGIFLLNLAVFTGFVFMPPEARAASSTAGLDRIATFVNVWLGYGKFYSLFSLLFGIGFALQLAAADRRGDGTLRLFRRRLLVLLAIGAVHMFFWEGDILFLYALVGFLLIPLRRMPPAWLLRTAIALVLAPVVLAVVTAVTRGALDPGAPFLRAGEWTLIASGFAPDALPYPLLRDAGWVEYLRFQVSGPFFRYADLLTTGRPFKVLAMFLVGLWVGRSGLLRDIGSWTPVLRRVRRWGFGIGLPAAAVQAVLMLTGTSSGALKVAEAAAYALGVAPLGLAYGATFALLWQAPAWRERLQHLAPAGRMALTNYLTQTAVSLLVFYGIGLGLMGRVGPVWWPAVVVVMLTVQVAASRWWLARYAFGPVEWIWRQATYGRRLPLRRATAAAPV